jgi:hypothetical protein
MKARLINVPTRRDRKQPNILQGPLLKKKTQPNKFVSRTRKEISQKNLQLVPKPGDPRRNPVSIVPFSPWFEALVASDMSDSLRSLKSAHQKSQNLLRIASAFARFCHPALPHHCQDTTAPTVFPRSPPSGCHHSPTIKTPPSDR